MQELISIIIPLYNKEQYILDCLSSCVNQTYKNFELIIVDDCSSDNSIEIARTYLKNQIIDFRIINQTENKGVSEARNLGFKEAKGRFVLFMDADDILHPQALEILYMVITENSAEVAITLRPSINEVRCDEQIPVDSIQCSCSITKNSICSIIGSLIEKEFLTNYNLCFEPGLNNGEDSIFTAEVLACASKAVCVNFSLYGYRKNVINSLRSGGWKNTTEELHRELLQLKVAQNHLNFATSKRIRGGEIEFIRNKKNAVYGLLFNEKIQLTEEEQYLLLKKVRIRDILSAKMSVKSFIFEIIMLFPKIDSERMFNFVYSFKKKNRIKK